MAIEYDGEVVVEIDGKEVDVASFDVTRTSGSKPVKTMNRYGRPRGSARGAKGYTIKITAPAPSTGEYPWSRMKDALIVTYPVGNPAKRTSYRDCNWTQIGDRYQPDNEMIRDIELYALDVVEPQ